MITVSNGWIAAHKETLLPEMFVEVICGVTEPGLHEDATATAIDESEYSDVSEVVSTEEKESRKYATLENGLWGLDGEFEYLTESPDDIGYVAEILSGEDGSFSEHPTITIDFGKQHTEAIPGVTITWGGAYNEWARDFKVSSYNAGVLVAQTVVRGNTSPVSVVEVDLGAYNRVVVEIFSWSLPYHRARCHDIYLGMEKIYTKNDLVAFDHSQEVDLLSAALPKNSIHFELRNDDDRWNPDSPIGSERYLMERQEVKVRYGMNVDGKTEWIKGGTFWLSEWSTPSNGMSASFTARDAVEFMGDIYTGPRKGTLYEIAVAALEQMEDHSFKWLVDTSLDDLTVDFSDDAEEYRVSEILQMVAHAGCCVFFQDRDGVVRIEPGSERYTNYKIEPHISYSHPEYTISKPLKAVSVSYGDNQSAVVNVGARGVVQTVDNPFVNTEEDALRVAKQTAKILEGRKVISGEFRADVRMDALDNIIVVSKYASNIIRVTEVKYSTTGGSFKGTYSGRVVSINLIPDKRYSGEFYVGEV